MFETKRTSRNIGVPARTGSTVCIILKQVKSHSDLSFMGHFVLRKECLF